MAYNVYLLEYQSLMMHKVAGKSVKGTLLVVHSSTPVKPGFQTYTPGWSESCSKLHIDSFDRNWLYSGGPSLISENGCGT